VEAVDLFLVVVHGYADMLNFKELKTVVPLTIYHYIIINMDDPILIYSLILPINYEMISVTAHKI
jgi:hypothetical protein